jgi:hypothetical protein
MRVNVYTATVRGGGSSCCCNTVECSSGFFGGCNGFVRGVKKSEYIRSMYSSKIRARQTEQPPPSATRLGTCSIIADDGVTLRLVIRQVVTGSGTLVRYGE